MKKVFLLLMLMGFAIAGLAQKTISGIVTDSEGDKLPGVNILAKGTNIVTITDANGSYTIKIPTNSAVIVFKFIGMEPVEKIIDESSAQRINMDVTMSSSSIGIEEVSVLASVATERKTPVAVSSIKPLRIEEKLGSQEYPEVLKSTPGIYATRQGGGFGDSRINVRGFDMKNTAVMINGIPINDMENGWVYWSNWAGLSEVTRTMQVQRGLGASKVSIGSIGGTINIITKTTDMEKGGSIYTGIGSDGYQKTTFTLSSGLLKGGWAVTLSGARKVGEGWVDATKFESYSYFLNISKRWSNQSLSFTLFGAPQTHGQRSSRLSIAEFKDPNKGLRYNADWGYKNGQVVNLRKNFYHKPQMSLNHYIDFSTKTKLSSALYMSFGTGGGTGPWGESGNNFYSYKKDNLIDFDRIYEENIAGGTPGNIASKAILRASRNDHNWYGLLSNLNHKLTDDIEISAGVDLRYYKGKHFREVVDLMGGDYVFDKSNKNKPVNLARVGDIIAYHNTGEVAWEGLFLQAEYSRDALSAFVSASVSNTGFRRTDYFNYLDSDPNQTSEWVNHIGYVAKGGANYNIDDYHNVFINAGYFERAPFFDAVFYDYKTNSINEGVKNEKTLALEGGYGFKSSTFAANVNAYYTNWIDKFLRRSFLNPATQERYQANIEGVDALHMGLEMDLKWNPFKNLEITGMVSLGDWSWQNNIKDVKIYDEDNTLVGEVNVYMKDLRVGDAAQHTYAIGINYNVFKDLRIGLDYNRYENLYSYFDPTGRSNESDQGINAWKMPAYGLLDANVSFKFKIAGLSAKWYANAHNVLNTEYLSDASDGSTHTWESARVFYGVGRTWTTGIKVRF